MKEFPKPLKLSLKALAKLGKVRIGINMSAPIPANEDENSKHSDNWVGI